MSPIRLLKFEAVALKDRESASGRAIKYREALERVAKRRGYHGWRACCSVLATTTVVECAAPNEAAARATTGMRRYRNTDWNFALDIPAPWKSFPPVANSSPFEVVRFKSNEDGSHFLIVLRQPHSPERSLTEIADNTQKALRRKGFMNFEFAETTTGSGTALVHSFNKPHPSETWSFRNYLIAEGAFVYTLGFGTNNGSGMSGLYDRVAKTFELLAEEGSFCRRCG